MIIKGSLGYDQYGRKRKAVQKRSKKPTRSSSGQDTGFSSQQREFEPRTGHQYPSAPVKPYTVPEDMSYKKEVSKQYTVAIAYNKGAYQVIPRKEVKDIGK